MWGGTLILELECKQDASLFSHVNESRIILLITTYFNTRNMFTAKGDTVGSFCF